VFTVREVGEPGDLGWMVERHGTLYAREYGWDFSMEALIARIVADFAEHHDPARERGWIAEVDGERAGCVLCVIVLWTNHPLTSARRLYEAAGFELDGEEPVHMFSKDLVSQTWSRAL
jgi:hypothetical protein